ncbi:MULTISPECIES: diaminopimelate epimerase [Tsukamurella]|uniref:Diaminopimelate epimerase n=2 Tax=Tsukamurella TaxID=2060 RepID=A0A5C5S028_9ACTN|nr:MULTISPECIES: diaminopimelate epimerase [Tsukamurella]NMD56142.1 diaminopimelate epimerase [Tsukamurella columbiensis]TWS28757.1 diaminopimelate epimerase [Tsukamurella conjunctivitidis]
MTAVDFLKGHGTENDFVILPDPGVDIDLTPELVTALCDRRAGIGGDGVLRVARAGDLLDAGVLDAVPEGVTRSDWFMDYRNSDGSIAEMCGNGVRVFAHFLAASALVAGETFVVGSRAGAKPVRVHHADPEAADVAVSMGVPRVFGTSSAGVDGRDLAGIAVDVGNPHIACVVPGLTEEALAALDVASAPTFDHGLFPHGTNVEVLTPLVDGAVHMRVHERGSGETRSCGTGTVAAAVAALRSVGRETGAVDVHVPGGVVTVTVDTDGAVLRGPSRIVASGTARLSAL